MKKYELIADQFIEVLGRKLYRIRALVSFSNVSVGDIGGYVESEKNLSGNAWVYGDAQVSGNAQVFGDAWVYGDARVFGDAQVSGNAWVSASARLSYKSFNGNSVTDFKASILATLRVLPIGSDYILYKRVNKVGDGKYRSCHDESFIYEDGKESVVADADTNPEKSCSSGIHVADPMYWDSGDTIIACQFRLEDVLAVQQGKVRVRRVLCLGECNV